MVVVEILERSIEILIQVSFEDVFSVVVLCEKAVFKGILMRIFVIVDEL